MTECSVNCVSKIICGLSLGNLLSDSWSEVLSSFSCGELSFATNSELATQPKKRIDSTN